jgi:hypothetical protein
MAVRGTDLLNACGPDVQAYDKLYNQWEAEFANTASDTPEKQTHILNIARSAFDSLSNNEALILDSRINNIETLKGRLKEIQKNDTTFRKTGRFFQAAGWGLVATVGVVTLLPLAGYLIFHATVGDPDKIDDTWKRRFSLTSKKELDVREEWKNMRDRWTSEQKVLNTPWQKGLPFQSKQVLADGSTILDPRKTILPPEYSKLISRVDQINDIFSKSIDENLAVRPSMLISE